MGRRDQWTDRQLYDKRAKRKRIHPAWRGIGCLMIILLGVAAYFLSGWFITSGTVYLPREARYALVPPLPPDAVIRGVVTFLVMLVSYTVMSVIYAIAFPVKLGEYDAPPPKRGKRKRKR